MHHAIHKVTRVRVIAPYTLEVQFADGTERRIDLGPVLVGELYGPLRDPALFEAVRIDPEVHTLVWPNGADFDPATLHDWPDYEQAFRRRAKRWELDRFSASD